MLYIFCNEMKLKKRKKELNNIVKIRSYKIKHLLLFEIIFFYFNILITYSSVYLNRKKKI